MLRVGTDCSGIEAPIVALRLLKVSVEHMFSSENDPVCRRVIARCFQPNHLYEDISRRIHKSLPSIDLYVCGFPCQPFSVLRHFEKDRELKKTREDARADVFLHMLKTIHAARPKMCVLENVPQFQTVHGGSLYKRLMVSLKKMDYEVHAKILNTQDYDVPQHRRRLYIVAIQRGIIRLPFAFPTPVPAIRPLTDFLVDKRCYEVTQLRSIQKRLPNDHGKRVYAVKYTGTAGTAALLQKCPCITTNAQIYLTKLNRRLSSREKLLLQGFPAGLTLPVNDTDLSRLAGNTMSVNVLCALFKQIFRAVVL